MPSPAPFSPGFRMSLLDGFVLVAGAAVAMFAARIEINLGLAVAFTVGHFFLFCNVVRMERVRELVWTAVFLVLASLTSSLQALSWNLTFGICLAVTAVLVVIELRSPMYHGIFWRRINPLLEARWQAQGGVLS